VMPAEEGLLVLVQVAAACAGVAAIVAVTAGIEERFAIEAPQPGHAMTTTRRNWLVGTFLFGLPAALVFLLASQVLGQWVAIGPRGTAGRISDAGPLLPLVLLEGAVAGLAVGPLVRLALPVEPGQRRLDGLLLAGVTAAVLGPAQFVLVRILGVVGVPLRFLLLPGVPVWPFAGTVAGLIVVFGGSTRRGAIAAVIAAITAGTVFPHQGSIALFARFPSSIWLMWVVGIPMAVGLRLGGSAFLRHWTLRWLLARDGLLPWDCLPFLDHMTRLHLLRRRGGGYEFIHRLLQEHLRDERAG